MELDDIARRADDVHAQLAHAASRVVPPNARALGADSAGALGVLGQALTAQADAAVAARIREADALGAAASGLASSLRTALAAYRDVEDRRAAPAGGS